AKRLKSVFDLLRVDRLLTLTDKYHFAAGVFARNDSRHHECFIAPCRRHPSQGFLVQEQNPSMNITDGRKESGPGSRLVVLHANLDGFDSVIEQFHCSTSMSRTRRY